MKTYCIIISVALILVFGSCEDSGINFTYSNVETNAAGTGTGGSMARFTISGDNLYTVDGTSLKTFNISSETDLRMESNWQLDWNGGVETIFPYENKLFLGTTTGMHIIDITDPDQPQYLSKYEHVVSCDPVVVQGNYAYVTLRSDNNWCGQSVNELQIIDISDLRNPKEVRSYSMGSPKGLGIDGDVLFVCDNGLKVYSMSSPTSLWHSNTFTNVNDAYDVIPYNGLLILVSADGLRQYVYESDQMTLISSMLTK